MLGVLCRVRVHSILIREGSCIRSENLEQCSVGSMILEKGEVGHICTAQGTPVTVVETAGEARLAEGVTTWGGERIVEKQVAELTFEHLS